MKKLLTLTMAALTAIVLAACGSASADDVIITNSGNISSEDLLDELLASEDAEMIIRSTVLKTILEDKYEVSDEDVDERFEELKEGAGENFDLILQTQGITEEQLKDDLRLSILQEQLFSEDLDITEEDIENFYEMMGVEVEASHILVEDEDLAKELIKELEDGADFAELAKEHSIDPGTAEEGGDVGGFTVGQFVIEFTEAAHALDVGEISEPVKSDHGFHIIKVTDKNEVDEIGTLEENRNFIFQSLIDAKLSQEDANAKINALIEDADVEIKLDQFKDLFDAPAESDIPTDGMEENPEMDMNDMQDEDSNENEANNNNENE